MFQFYHLSRTVLSALIGIYLSLVVFSSPSQAVLIYNWTFTDSTHGHTTPIITGRIAFNSANPGVGYTNLVPDSLIITSAPGHVFNSGTNPIGVELVPPGPSTGLEGPFYSYWSIDSITNLPTAGVMTYNQSPNNTPTELFSLRGDNSAINPSSLYTSADNSYTQGVASFTRLPGDYNANGTVDAADYVVWRKNNGTQSDYNLWRSHFGQTAGSGAGAIASAAVPEPTTLVPLIFTTAGWRLRRRRAA